MPATVPALQLRRLTRGDFALLARWLAEPHVARWWAHQTSAAAIEADFGGCIDGTELADVFIVEAAEKERHLEPVGLVQRYRLADYGEYLAELAPIVAIPDEAFGIDYFIGEPDTLMRGLGTAMIRTTVESIWRDHPRARAVIVPVHAANVASWHVLERAGFARVAEGLLEPDNPVDSRDHYVYRVDRAGIESSR